MTVDLTNKDVPYESGLPCDKPLTNLFGDLSGGIGSTPGKHTHGVAERETGGETYRMQQSNYDYSIIHNKARHYYGNKEQVIPGDYVLTANRIYLESNETHSSLDGKVWNKGSVTTYNEGKVIKDINSHKLKLSVDKILAKSEFAFSLLHTNTDIAFQNMNFTYGGGVDFQLGGNVNVYVGWPDTDNWLKDNITKAGPKAAVALKAVKFLGSEPVLSLLGATRTDVTIGERRTASGREESYAQEVDAAAKSYLLTAELNEQLSKEARIFADDSLQIWVGKKKEGKLELTSQNEVWIYAQGESVIGSNGDLSLFSKEGDIVLGAGENAIQISSKDVTIAGMAIQKDSIQIKKGAKKPKSLKLKKEKIRDHKTLNKKDESKIGERLDKLYDREEFPSTKDTMKKVGKIAAALMAVAIATSISTAAANAAAP